MEIIADKDLEAYVIRHTTKEETLVGQVERYRMALEAIKSVEQFNTAVYRIADKAVRGHD